MKEEIKKDLIDYLSGVVNNQLEFCTLPLEHAEFILSSLSKAPEKKITDLDIAEASTQVDLLKKEGFIQGAKWARDNFKAPEKEEEKIYPESFVEWAGEHYTRLNKVWVHRFNDQTNRDNWKTTEQVYRIWKNVIFLKDGLIPPKKLETMEEEKTIEIEGKKYIYIPPSPKRPSKSMTLLMGMAMMFSPEPPVTSNRSKVSGLSINEIVDEYKLILQKKSKLSRAQREAVIWKFKKNFKEIE